MGTTVLADTLPTTSDRSAFMTTGPDFGSHPEYFVQRQRNAWERFQSLPAPTRKDETWRFADTKQISLAGFQRAEPISDADQAALLARSKGLAETAGRMVFANDRLLGRHFHGESLRAKGVLWLPLEQAIVEQRELIERYFMREDAVLGSAKFAALHQSQVRAGMFLYVPKGVEIALPVETFHWLSGENASVFPHTLIIAEENSRVVVLDHFESAADARGLAVGVNDIVVGAGAKVTYVATQNWSRQTLAFHLNNTVVDRDASALALTMNLGGAFVRGEALSHLRGQGGRSDMLSVSAAEGSQIFDQRTLQVHEVPNTSSDLLYKNALNDTARTIFTGLIRVDEGAHKTDAYQKVRNLLLSDEAEANSAPGLEIEADDVRCTHGATSGTLEGEELFYFESRGIPRRVAQQLITFGFLNEVFDRLPVPAIQGKLREMLHGKLG
jgi:Fe-S cluster assembly protein SufD